MEVKAAVSQSLLVSVLLGTDTAQLEQLLQSNPLALRTSSLEQALVTTRGQSRRQAEEEREQQKHEARSGVQPQQLTEDIPTQDRLEELGGEHGVGGLEVAEQEEGVEVNHTLEEVPGAGCEEVMGDGCEGVMGDGCEGVMGDGCEGVMGEDLFGEFVDDLFLPSAERRRSRAEKRKKRHVHGLERAADRRGSGGRPQRSGLDMSRTELQ